MTNFQSSDNNIERKKRRAYDFLINSPSKDLWLQVFGEGLADLLSAIFIAIDEDYTNYNNANLNPLVSGLILPDTSTQSNLNPLPKDKSF